MIQIAAADPVIHVMLSRIEKNVKTANPRLYIRTRPYMSPTRPRLTTSTLVTSRNPMRIHRKYDVLPGASGSILMPRKMSGSAMRRIDALMVAIKTPMVVLESAIHL